MSAAPLESSSPLVDSRMAARRMRLADLALIVFELIRERYRGGMLPKYDGVEDPGLIRALRECASFVEQVDCLDFDERFVIRIEGIDGLDYLIQIALHEPGFSVLAARVSVSRLTLSGDEAGREAGPSLTLNTLGASREDSVRLKLDGASTDRAFLIGMARVIGLMDRRGEDPDGRLGALAEQVTPRRDELRALRARLPLPTISYDDEEEQPF